MDNMKTDIEIARETKLENIRDIAARVGFPDEEVFNYGDRKSVV